MRAAVLVTILTALAVPASAGRVRRQCKHKNAALSASAPSTSDSTTAAVPTATGVPGAQMHVADPAASSSSSSSSEISSQETSHTETADAAATTASVEPQSTESTQTTTAEPQSTESTPTTTADAQATTAADPSDATFGGTNDPAAYTPDSMQQDIVHLHNTVRAQFSASPLSYNQSLAEYAAGNADQCLFQHSQNLPSGENIAAATQPTSLEALFNMWAGEESQYPWSAPTYDAAWGHWTQIVWKDTTSVGCAWKTCADGTIFSGHNPSVYLVCEYYPPGNVVSNDDAETAKTFSSEIGPKV